MIDPEDLERAVLETQAELATVKHVLGTLIAWIVQSANSPLSLRDAQSLMDMLPQDKEAS